MNQDKNEETKQGSEDTLKDMLTGQDTPLGEKAPAAPFALVALSYPIILSVGVLAMAFYFWLR